MKNFTIIFIKILNDNLKKKEEQYRLDEEERRLRYQREKLEEDAQKNKLHLDNISFDLKRRILFKL